MIKLFPFFGRRSNICSVYLSLVFRAIAHLRGNDVIGHNYYYIIFPHSANDRSLPSTHERRNSKEKNKLYESGLLITFSSGILLLFLTIRVRSHTR